MSVVRCGNRECKKYLQKSDAVSNGFSHFCDRDCMLSQQKATQPRKKASQATNSPTDTELAMGANWTLVHSGEGNAADRSYIDHKAIAICRIISKG